MARRSLLTDAERERLFGVPTGRDELGQNERNAPPDTHKRTKHELMRL